MKKEAFSEDQLAMIEAARLREPDTADIPEAPVGHWASARQPNRSPKEAISIRIDADVLDWLRRRFPRYQPEINRMLRAHMEREQGERRTEPSREVVLIDSQRVVVRQAASASLGGASYEENVDVRTAATVVEDLVFDGPVTISGAVKRVALQKATGSERE